MQIHIVLVAPARPENIGAAARAMKTMGFSSLRIVDSQAYLEPATRWVAHGSGDILDNAQHFNTLEAALADVDFTVATTARSRARYHYYCSPQELTGILQDCQLRYCFWSRRVGVIKRRTRLSGYSDGGSDGGGLSIVEFGSGGDGVLLSAIVVDTK